MNRSRVLITSASLLAVLVAVLALSLSGVAEAKTKKHNRYAAKASNNCPTRVTVNGDIVDCNGWRLRPGGWDNTCFNLDYLPSMYACSSRGRR